MKPLLQGPVYSCQEMRCALLLGDFDLSFEGEFGLGAIVHVYTCILKVSEQKVHFEC